LGDQRLRLASASNYSENIGGQGSKWPGYLDVGFSTFELIWRLAADDVQGHVSSPLPQSEIGLPRSATPPRIRAAVKLAQTMAESLLSISESPNS